MMRERRRRNEGNGRDDPRGDLFGLTTATGLSTSQLVSLFVAACSIVFMIMRLRKAETRAVASVPDND